MKVLEEGHVYELEQHDPNVHPERIKVYPANCLIFVNREEGKEHPGTQTQEAIRALIDRTMHCDSCLPSEFDPQIIYHLRMALTLHEARALIRKVEKGILKPETVQTAIGDGHFKMYLQQVVDTSDDHIRYVSRREAK